MKQKHPVDASRVFVTGLSAGGAMTSVMLATYPDVFAGGATMAGVAYGANIGETKSAMALGDSVRAAYPAYHGPWPRLSVWQGQSDSVVSPSSATALVSQWTNVNGQSGTATSTNTVAGAMHSSYADAQGRVVVESDLIPGMGHGTALHVPFAAAGGCGKAGISDSRPASARPGTRASSSGCKRHRGAATAGAWPTSGPVAAAQVARVAAARAAAAQAARVAAARAAAATRAARTARCTQVDAPSQAARAMRRRRHRSSSCSCRWCCSSCRRSIAVAAETASLLLRRALARNLRALLARLVQARSRSACLRLLTLCLPERMWCISVRTWLLALRRLFLPVLVVALLLRLRRHVSLRSRKSGHGGGACNPRYFFLAVHSAASASRPCTYSFGALPVAAAFALSTSASASLTRPCLA